MTASEVAAVLDARKIGDGKWLGRCPAHQDTTPSLSVRAAADRTLLYCFAGCTASAVVAAVGLSLADLFNDPVCKTKETRFRQIAKAPRKPKDPGRLLRDEVLARRIVESYAERLLMADPDNGDAWEALRVAYFGLVEAEHRLDVIERRRI